MNPRRAVFDARSLCDFIRLDLMLRWLRTGIPSHTTLIALCMAEQGGIECEPHIGAGRVTVHASDIQGLEAIVERHERDSCTMDESAGAQLAEDLPDAVLVGCFNHDPSVREWVLKTMLTARQLTKEEVNSLRARWSGGHIESTISILLSGSESGPRAANN